MDLIGLDPDDAGDQIRQYREDEWKRGIHEMRNGTEIRIKDMDDQHLRNTINYFSDSHDTSVLEKELKKRTSKRS